MHFLNHIFNKQIQVKPRISNEEIMELRRSDVQRLWGGNGE